MFEQSVSSIKLSLRRKYLFGSDDFPLKNYAYLDDNKTSVNVVIKEDSYRKVFVNDNPDVYFGAEAWYIRECHKSGGKGKDKQKRRIKINVSIEMVSTQLQTFLEYFIGENHAIFEPKPYGGESYYMTHQGESFRYHADKHHLLDPDNVTLRRDIKEEITDCILYHSVGLAVNDKPNHRNKFGNVELKFSSPGGYYYILNIHLMSKPEVQLPSKDAVEAMIMQFRKIVYNGKYCLKSMFGNGMNIEYMLVDPSPTPPAPQSPILVTLSPSHVEQESGASPLPSNNRFAVLSDLDSDED